MAVAYGEGRHGDLGQLGRRAVGGCSDLTRTANGGRDVIEAKPQLLESAEYAQQYSIKRRRAFEWSDVVAAHGAPSANANPGSEAAISSLLAAV